MDDGPQDAGNTGSATAADDRLPRSVAVEAARLTTEARRADNAKAARRLRDERAELLAAHGFRSRVREADDVLVCHPAEWVVDGEVRFDAVDETERAVELPLAGAADPDEWEAVEAHNAALVAAVRGRADEHAEVHAANARAFADFVGNHYAKRVERATAEERREFREEYFPRNAWPNDPQRALLDESLELLFSVADTENREAE